ncbi:hypothetical protein M752DRAFT_334546 [Aspergillus phoenicis ATCC 13157]|uniref:Carbohydrate-binding module family 18 protein n=1 Tax=Aspergillus phoenicis ATCC 13157 TaxID=1353007 RepID=A0A370PR44_ASPPH|nr:hypothetical protein CBS147346_9415 [Aspergillus niger]RDK44677.1 hypothetical protein M752DRAFT_334546 [Aspergillus phoenicis ATCC 13157]GLA29971.1 hypothetical protein AnigIFM63326_008166 [Aspergillus niger]
MASSSTAKNLRLGWVLGLTWCSLVHAVSNNTLFIYTSSALNTSLFSTTCLSALTASVPCYSGLGTAVFQTTVWSSHALDLICAETCQTALNSYVATVKTACGTDALYNISGVLQTASDAGSEMLWKQSATCLTDASSGDYCNSLFQTASSNGVNLTCNNCALDYMTTLVNAPWGQQILDPVSVSSRISGCSASNSYSVTYTASSTPAATTSAIASGGDNVRCNITDPSSTLYRVSANQTCLDISVAANVSTPTLANINALGPACSYLKENQTLCLPDVCDLYTVSANDTCASILGNVRREISTPTFRSWNPAINSACSNLQALEGQYICLSPPGTTAIPDSFALKAVTTAAPVPDNAVTTSNTDCGYWYTIQDGDNCDSVSAMFSIPKNDFYFLNPQLGNSCASLWLGSSYCVQAVGSIQTYTGYPSSSSTSLPALATTVNVNATVTANRTTSWLLPTGLSISTSTGIYNVTAYEMTKSYTLCQDAMSYYSLDDDNFIMSDLMTNTAWYSEWDRVCDLDLSQPTPTIPFNTSIPLVTGSETATASTSGDAAAGSTSTIASASRTATSTTSSTSTTVTSTTTTSAATATATGLIISPDGTCGGTTGYTCEQSAFGDCCSIWGDCGSTSDYCAASSCDSNAGVCAGGVSPNGLCGASNNDWTCFNSGFGDCCDTYGYCGSTDDYCGASCDSSYGPCSGTISPNGLCGADNGGYTCFGSQFGSCCSIYGYCGSTDEYCASAICDSSYGGCN